MENINTRYIQACLCWTYQTISLKSRDSVGWVFFRALTFSCTICKGLPQQHRWGCQQLHPLQLQPKIHFCMHLHFLKWTLRQTSLRFHSYSDLYCLIFWVQLNLKKNNEAVWPLSLSVNILFSNFTHSNHPKQQVYPRSAKLPKHGHKLICGSCSVFLHRNPDGFVWRIKLTIVRFFSVFVWFGSWRGWRCSWNWDAIFDRFPEAYWKEQSFASCLLLWIKYNYQSRMVFLSRLHWSDMLWYQ